MRFEDYLYKEVYESVCKDYAYKHQHDTRHMEKERRREKSKRNMLTITGLCFVAIFLFLCISFFTQNEPKELDEDLPTEVIVTSVTYEEPIESISEEALEDFENEKIQEALIAKANRIDNVTVSHYCTEKYPHICNAGEPYKTARGNDVIPGLTCAVDPKVIPLGSTVFIDYGDGVIYEYFADDTGGAIKGSQRIDVAVDTHDYANELGLRDATVWWIKE